MSFSNPLLSDPSIIQVSRGEDTASNSNIEVNNTSQLASNLTSSSGLEPGSALSKLLDSAMANAAKESTPELEPRSATASPFVKSPSLSSVQSKNKNSHLVYSIDYLLTLRESPLIKSYDGSPELPDKTFWRLKARNPSKNDKDFNSNQKGNHYHNNHHHNNAGNNNNNNKRHSNNKSFDWERKSTGFNKANDLDSLSADKISQLLGEAADEAQPEWDAVDLSADEMKINMAQTVEDFEKWKSNMRNEERKRNGDISNGTDASPLQTGGGNEVDNFFSFVKPKTDSFSNSTKNPKSTTSSTPSTAHAEVANKSSRFSSFFNTPSSENTPPLKERPLDNSVNPQKQMLGSRFFSAASTPSSTTVPPITSAPPQQNPIPVLSNAPPPGIPQPVQGSSTNDSFFLSLMNKRESNDSTQANTPQPGASNLLRSLQGKGPSGDPGNIQSPLISHNSTPVQTPGSHPAQPVGQDPKFTGIIQSSSVQHSPLLQHQILQQSPHSQQHQQRRQSSHSDRNFGLDGQPGQQGQPLPPWFRQLQNGPNGPSGPSGPIGSIVPGPLAGQANGPLPTEPIGNFPGGPVLPPNVQHSKGEPNTNGPPPGMAGPPPHMQFGGPPPPGMFPPGFMPPPGMQLPPGQFPGANGRNGPQFPPGMPPPPNGQFYGFPPGVPPPPQGIPLQQLNPQQFELLQQQQSQHRQ